VISIYRLDRERPTMVSIQKHHLQVSVFAKSEKEATMTSDRVEELLHGKRSD
jgi:type IV secretory pathway VirB4 component